MIRAPTFILIALAWNEAKRSAHQGNHSNYRSQLIVSGLVDFIGVIYQDVPLFWSMHAVEEIGFYDEKE